MRLITSSLVAAGTVAGLAGAVLTYQSAAPPKAPVDTPVAAAAVEAPASEVITRLRPCDKGTKLVKGVCIRTKHRVIVHEVPAPAAAPIPASIPRPSTPPPPRNSGDNGPSRPQKSPTVRNHTDDEAEHGKDHDDDDRDGDEDHEDEDHHGDHDEDHDEDHDDDHDDD